MVPSRKLEPTTVGPWLNVTGFELQLATNDLLSIISKVSLAQASPHQDFLHNKEHPLPPLHLQVNPQPVENHA